jgi:hypothetical protein
MYRTTDKVSFFIVFIFYISSIGIGYFFYERIDFKKSSVNKRHQLNHIVLIKFKQNTPLETLSFINNAVYKLEEIKEVNELYYAKNISSRKMDKGFTHIIKMKFKNSYDMDSIYMPHPIHTNFGKIFHPHAEDVLVYNYWD